MPARIRVLPLGLLASERRMMSRTMVSAVLIAALGLACGKSTTGPSDGLASASLTITSVAPAVGTTNYPQLTSVRGTGFAAGATVSLGGVLATPHTIASTQINMTTPIHDAGVVDVVVTNLDGKSVTLPRGFTFHPVTLTANPGVVSAGGSLSVSWTALGRPLGYGDWVGLFPVGASSFDYEQYWWRYVSESATAATLALSAPTQPGEYEFRYFPDDGYVIVATAPVSVQ